MSGVGTVLDAVRRQRSNREMQKWLRSRYSQKLSNLPNTNSKKFNKDFDQKLSSDQLAKIKQEIRDEVRQDMIKAYSMGIILTLLVIGLLWYLLS